jgi:dihydrofolate synthase / folylpolyglutamate synthase
VTNYIDTLLSLPYWDGRTPFGIETPRRLLHALGNPQDKLRSIHVAGTNGKGSVCSLLSSMLYCAGFSVGQFSSPHLSNITERCIINGVPVSTEAFNDSLGEVFHAAERENLSPSFFEIVTAASFVEFERQGLDWIVVEVGLGGRLDATNTITAPKATIITTISFDHTHILGETLGEIAREKGGIFKPGVPAYCGLMSDEAKAVLLDTAREVGVDIKFLGEDFEVEDFHLPALVGRHQLCNASLAVNVARELGCGEEEITEGIFRVRWPGRLEELELAGGKRVILDAAHNPAGIKSLCDFLGERIKMQGGRGKYLFLFSVMERKDWTNMLEIVRSFASNTGVKVRFIFTTNGDESSLDPAKLWGFINAGEVIEDPIKAFKFACDAQGEDEVLVVTGSIYLIGKLRPVITDTPFVTIC